MIQHNCIGEMSAIPTAAPSAEETRLVVPGISPGTRAPKGRAGAISFKVWTPSGFHGQSYIDNQ